MKAFTSTLALSFGLLAAGCGSLSGDANSERVLTTLHGQLDNPQSVALSNGSSNVRVAVIWRSVADDNGFSVAEDLPVQPVFPSAFEISLDGPPPADAMNSGAELADADQAPAPTTANGSGSSGGATPAPSVSAAPSTPSGGGSSKMQNDPTVQFPADFQFAVGQVVAYQDLNGNGALDLVGDNATAYTDQIVGANENLVLVYFSGTMPAGNFFADTSGKLPSLGYNIYSTPACEVQIPADNGSDAGSTGTTTCSDTTQWFDMSTLYDLPVSNDPTLNDLMCEDGESSSSTGTSNGVNPEACVGSPGAPQASYPTGGYCSPDGTSISYSACTTTSAGPCKGTVQTCNDTQVCRPSPIPANWPCPAASN